MGGGGQSCISCEFMWCLIFSNNQNHVNWKEEKKMNAETFGASSLNAYNRRGFNYRGRGGFRGQRGGGGYYNNRGGQGFNRSRGGQYSHSLQKFLGGQIFELGKLMKIFFLC